MNMRITLLVFVIIFWVIIVYDRITIQHLHTELAESRLKYINHISSDVCVPRSDYQLDVYPGLNVIKDGNKVVEIIRYDSTSALDKLINKDNK